MRTSVALLLSVAPVLLAQSEDRVRQTFPVQSGGRLVLTTEGASVQVEPGAAQAVDFEVFFRGRPATRSEYDRLLQDFSIDISHVGSDVRIASRYRGSWFDRAFFWGPQSWMRGMQFRATVPAAYNVEVNTSGGSITVGDLKGEARVRTSGGSLHLGRIDGPVDGRTSGGSITLRGSKDRALLHTSGGSIRIEEAAGDVDAETSGGSIEIARTTGRVIAHTSGGGITVRDAAGAVDASTSGGSISVSLPSGKGFDIDAKTSGGSVSSDFAVTVNGHLHSRELRGPTNGGGPLVRLRTSGGGIRIRKSVT